MTADPLTISEPSVAELVSILKTPSASTQLQSETLWVIGLAAVRGSTACERLLRADVLRPLMSVLSDEASVADVITPACYTVHMLIGNGLPAVLDTLLQAGVRSLVERVVARQLAGVHGPAALQALKRWQ